MPAIGLSLKTLPTTSEKHLRSVAKEVGSPIQAVMEIGRELGPIFRVKALVESTVVVWGHDLVHEICDDALFDKKVVGGVAQARRLAGDGLFTAHTSEPNWARAHNILLSSFSPKAMKRYLGGMQQIARQLITKWDKAASCGSVVDVPHDMTSLTLDTIGLCGFNYRFESFNSEEPHPFIVAMTDSLLLGQETQMEHPLVRLLKSYSKIQRVDADVTQMQQIVDGIIAERKSVDGRGADDLLQSMLEGVDPQSGGKLDDTNMRNQILTFLVAGHETTSGLLSFALYFLTQNPDVLERAYREVDTVLGSDLEIEPDEGQLNSLDLVPRILNETLRLWPTAPMFTRTPYEDIIVGGKYAIPAGTPMRVLVPMLHRDERVWSDPERFDPDRFLPEAEQARPPDCYKPFGTGQRACIGRAFALREAALVLAMVLQRYKFRTPEPYSLHLISTLTIKPADFNLILEPRLESERAAREDQKQIASQEGSGVLAQGSRLTVLFGTNMGTCRDFADRIVQDARTMGFEVQEKEFDAAVEDVPTEGVVIAIVSSYNGAPPSNAVQFMEWLAGCPDGAMERVRYTVFGSGNRDWASTYQAVPRRLDEQFESLGAQRFYKRGEGDARADLDGDFEDWYSGLWEAVGKTLGLATGARQIKRGPLYQLIRMENVHKNPFAQSFQAQPMTIVENRELQTSGPRSTRHIEIALPAGVTYKTGDHLGVLAGNDPKLVSRIAAHFGLEPESRIILKQLEPGKSVLPTDEVISIGNILTDYLELHSPASREQIRILASACLCPPDRARLEALMGDEEAYRSEIIAKNRSVFDLLESCPGCQLSLEQYLEMTPALKPRYYSISSSPRAMGRLCSITVGVVEGPARSGRGVYHGTASSFLASLARGSEVFSFVHDTGSCFRLPLSSATPIILVGAGTGVAPYRGFLQERALLQQQGEQLGPALLFFGFRHSTQDYIYRSEFEEFQSEGVAEVVTAPSRETERKIYVQNRIVEEAERVWALLSGEGVVYVCGDASRMAPSVREAFKSVFRMKVDDNEEAAEEWMLELQRSGRYLTDVWASS